MFLDSFEIGTEGRETTGSIFLAIGTIGAGITFVATLALELPSEAILEVVMSLLVLH